MCSAGTAFSCGTGRTFWRCRQRAHGSAHPAVACATAASTASAPAGRPQAPFTGAPLPRVSQSVKHPFQHPMADQMSNLTSRVSTRHHNHCFTEAWIQPQNDPANRSAPWEPQQSRVCTPWCVLSIHFSTALDIIHAPATALHPSIALH